MKSEGKGDYAGGIAAWEKLLTTNPDYADAAKVRSLIAEAQQKMVGAPLPTH